MKACHSIKEIKLLVDTREKPTEDSKRRLELVGYLFERVKLNVGDYSATCELANGEIIDFQNKFVIERKMSIDELACCFGTERDRFQREFERAKDAGTKIYLLVENANWEKIYAHKYKSELMPNALIASIDTFRVRYDMRLDFCTEVISGSRIKSIIYREVLQEVQNRKVDYGKEKTRSTFNIS